MSSAKNGNKATEAPVLVSWPERKVAADMEEKALQNDLQHLKTWIETIDKMNDEELKIYLKTRPIELGTMNSQRSTPRIQRARKYTSSASNGLMASVWKFHKEDDDGGSSLRPNVK